MMLLIENEETGQIHMMAEVELAWILATHWHRLCSLLISENPEEVAYGMTMLVEGKELFGEYAEVSEPA